MDFKSTLGVSVLIAGVAWPSVDALAEPALGVHEHGHARLELAVQGQRLDIYFESPAMNIIGFEHPPQSADQEMVLAEAVQWFEKQPLVAVAGLDCELVSAQVEETVSQPESSGTHSEVRVNQRIDCDSSVAGATVSARVLDAFSGIETLETAWVTSQQQGGKVLDRQDSRVRLAN